MHKASPKARRGGNRGTHRTRADAIKQSVLDYDPTPLESEYDFSLREEIMDCEGYRPTTRRMRNSGEDDFVEIRTFRRARMNKNRKNANKSQRKASSSTHVPSKANGVRAGNPREPAYLRPIAFTKSAQTWPPRNDDPELDEKEPTLEQDGEDCTSSTSGMTSARVWTQKSSESASDEDEELPLRTFEWDEKDYVGMVSSSANEGEILDNVTNQLAATDIKVHHSGFIGTRLDAPVMSPDRSFGCIFGNDTNADRNDAASANNRTYVDGSRSVAATLRSMSVVNPLQTRSDDDPPVELGSGLTSIVPNLNKGKGDIVDFAEESGTANLNRFPYKRRQLMSDCVSEDSDENAALDDYLKNTSTYEPEYVESFTRCLASDDYDSASSTSVASDDQDLSEDNEVDAAVMAEEKKFADPDGETDSVPQDGIIKRDEFFDGHDNWDRSYLNDIERLIKGERIGEESTERDYIFDAVLTGDFCRPHRGFEAQIERENVTVSLFDEGQKEILQRGRQRKEAKMWRRQLDIDAFDAIQAKKKERKQREKARHEARKANRARQDSGSMLHVDIRAINEMILEFVHDESMQSLELQQAMPFYCRRHINILAKHYYLNSDAMDGGPRAKREIVTLSKTERTRVGENVMRYLAFAEKDIERKSVSPNYQNQRQSNRVKRKGQNLNYKLSKEKAPTIRAKPGSIVGASAPPIQSNNIGHKLLSKMGWSEGQTLGVAGSGTALPVEVRIPYGKAGLGAKDFEGKHSGKTK